MLTKPLNKKTVLRKKRLKTSRRLTQLSNHGLKSWGLVFLKVTLNQRPATQKITQWCLMTLLSRVR